MLGGEPVDQGILDRLREVFPDARISWIYASSEAGAAIAVHDGLAGFPETWLEREVAGRPRLSVEDGELLFLGGQVFSGYWRNDAATAEVLEASGWFHTGDVGEIDDEGFVRITGRKKEILVTAGGKNVAPAVRSSPPTRPPTHSPAA